METKCPMCKQRFYWIEREAKEKKEKEKNDGEGDDDDDDDNNSSITSGINDIKNNQREKPTYCPLKNQNGNQEEEDEDLDPAEHIICTVCQSGDDERNLLLCDGCDEGYHVSCVGLQRVPRGDGIVLRARGGSESEKREKRIEGDLPVRRQRRRQRQQEEKVQRLEQREWRERREEMPVLPLDWVC